MIGLVRNLAFVAAAVLALVGARGAWAEGPIVHPDPPPVQHPAHRDPPPPSPAGQQDLCAIHAPANAASCEVTVGPLLPCGVPSSVTVVWRNADGSGGGAHADNACPVMRSTAPRRAGKSLLAI